MKFLLIAAIVVLPLFSQAKITLALNWKAEPQFGGFYEADIKGFYKSRNLDVEVLEGSSGLPTIQMIAAGKVDYATVSGDEIVISHDRGAKDVVAIFATYQTIPVGIMARADKNYKSIQDVLKDSSATLQWEAGLPYAQFIKKNFDIKAKTAPYGGGIANFVHDPSIVQQCFLTSEPILAEKAGIKVTGFSVAEAGYNPYTTVLVTTKTRLKAHPTEVKAMIEAVRAGWKSYLNSDKDANLAMSKINKAMDLNTFADSAKAQKKFIEVKGTELGTMTEKRWQSLADQLLDLKMIKSKVDAKEIFQN